MARNKRNRSKRSNKRGNRNSHDPPQVLLTPFNQITAVFQQPISDAWYKYSTIIKKVEEQTKLTLPDATIKLKSIHIYGKADGTSTIGFQVFSPVQSGNQQPDILCTKSDSPGKNHRASIHYKWPYQLRETPIRCLKAEDEGFVFGLSGEIDLIHVYLVWRPNTFVPTTAVRTVDYGTLMENTSLNNEQEREGDNLQQVSSD